MKTIIIIISTFILTGCATTVHTPDIGPHKIRRVVRRFKASGRRGRVFEAYKLNGEYTKHGKDVTYYDLPLREGIRFVKTIEHWKHGIRNGRFTEKYLNGNIKTVGNYVDGKKNGKWRSFSELGSALKVIEYKNGELISNYSNSPAKAMSNKSGLESRHAPPTSP